MKNDDYSINFIYFAEQLCFISSRRTYDFLMLSICNRGGLHMPPDAKYPLKFKIVENNWNLMHILLVNCVQLLN